MPRFLKDEILSLRSQLEKICGRHLQGRSDLLQRAYAGRGFSVLDQAEGIEV